jgi:phthalate 4,5-cis-dihydrodiol dehydrogenase
VTRSGPILGVGIVGLGGASLGMLPKIQENPGFRVAAVADIDQEILGRFAKDFPDAKTYTAVAEMSGDPSVDLVYIATPNSLHSEHARVALEQKRHVLIEKPMTIALEDSDVMIETAERNGVLLGVNVKHSFEARVKKLRDFVRSGELGQFRMMNSWRYADWLYRPRTPEELTPEPGGGILWRQGPHQFDILRTIGGGMVRSVKGLAAVWDASRRVPGSHAAYLDFEEGAVATAVFSGYDHFDSRELVYGPDKADPPRHAVARREHREATDPNWEATAARDERYGGSRSGSGQAQPATPSATGWITGGPLVASFDHADVRFSPDGLEVFSDDARYEIDLKSTEDGRDGRLNTYYDAIVNGKPLPADGRWGKGTLELLLAIEKSSITRSEVHLVYQVPTVDY